MHQDTEERFSPGKAEAAKTTNATHVFKESLCRADEYGRPIKYWNPVKKEHYVMQVAAKGQQCRILRDCGKGIVEVEFTVVANVDGKGNRILKMKKEKVAKELLEEEKPKEA